MDNKEKAKIINKYFGVFGYGNFDITEKELSELLDMEDEKSIKAFYERLEKQRMG